MPRSKIGDSVIMLSDEFAEMGARSPQSLGGSPVSIHLYVKDADAMFNQAVAAGAKSSGRSPTSSMAIAWAELKIHLDIRGGSRPTRKTYPRKRSKARRVGRSLATNSLRSANESLRTDTR